MVSLCLGAAAEPLVTPSRSPSRQLVSRQLISQQQRVSRSQLGRMAASDSIQHHRHRPDCDYGAVRRCVDA